jgi:hypothetical protein
MNNDKKEFIVIREFWSDKGLHKIGSKLLLDKVEEINMKAEDYIKDLDEE